MPFGQSAIIALVSAELSGLLLERVSDLTPRQIAFCKGVIAFLAGEATAIPTVDAIGGALTIPIALTYVMRALDVPPELQGLIRMVVGGLTGADPDAVLETIDALDAALV